VDALMMDGREGVENWGDSGMGAVWRLGR